MPSPRSPRKRSPVRNAGVDLYNCRRWSAKEVEKEAVSRGVPRGRTLEDTCAALIRAEAKNKDKCVSPAVLSNAFLSLAKTLEIAYEMRKEHLGERSARTVKQSRYRFKYRSFIRTAEALLKRGVPNCIGSSADLEGHVKMGVGTRSRIDEYILTGKIASDPELAAYSSGLE